MISKEIIQKNFSAAAENYDKHNFLQRRIGEELIGRILSDKKDHRLILDVGTGTGSLLKELSSRFPSALIFGLDISLAMLKKIKIASIGRRLFQADAEYLPVKSGVFDLVVSNLVYQWLINLDKAFMRAGKILKQNGDFYFTFFTKDTLFELRECISSVNKAYSFTIFPSKDDIYHKLTAAGFKDIEIIFSMEEEFFSDFYSLINWLKSCGANRLGVKFPGLGARGLLNKIDKFYSGNFRHNGKIVASFEKVIVKAVRK